MKTNIEIITASAGTGKTTQLTLRLEEAVDPEKHQDQAELEAKPERILATTFTKKAAAELALRVRQQLLQSGKIDLARRLGAARIGTVNSVCSSLVEDFALELGLAPALRVIDPDAAEREFLRSLSDSVRDDDLGALADLESRNEALDWEKNIKKLAERARQYGHSPQDLQESCTQNVKELRDALTPRSSKKSVEEKFLDALKALESELASYPKLPKTVSDPLSDAQRLGDELREARKPAWNKWRKVASIKVSGKWKSTFAPICRAAEAHIHHPDLIEDLCSYVEIAFRTAANSIKTYESHKKRLGVIDFADQEVLALKALKDDAVQEALAEKIDLLLVDEFQDTSPIQLEIFLKLAEIAKRSIWVGDPKQSIYAFRDADPALMDEAMQAILGDRPPTLLTTSYRSRQELVRVTSELFAPAFEGQGILKEHTELIAQEKNPLGDNFVTMERWSLVKEYPQSTIAAKALATGIEKLVCEGDLVRDPSTGEHRKLDYEHIAVLCRTNSQCEKAAIALEDRGIPVSIHQKGLSETLEASLMRAGLGLWQDSRDRLALAELGKFCTTDEDQWIKQVFSPTGMDAMSELPEARNILEANRGTPDLGLVAVFDVVANALDVREKCLEWGGSELRLANLDALRAAAVRFCEFRESMGLPASVSSFLHHLESEQGRDEPQSAQVGNAVQVMTLHGAKGLEWPIVVLPGLEQRPVFRPFGVHVVRDKNMSIENPRGGRSLRFYPSPYRIDKPPIEKLEMLERILQIPAVQKLKLRSEEEALRVLYVGWTRACDRLVLAMNTRAGTKTYSVEDREENLKDGYLGILGPHELEDPLLHCGGDQSRVITKVGTKDVEWICRRIHPEDPQPTSQKPGKAPVARGTRPYPAARIAPSDVTGRGHAIARWELGEPLEVASNTDMQRLGEAVHSFLAADQPEIAYSDRMSLATDLLDRWEVTEAMAPPDIILASDRLKNWASENSEAIRWHHEVPLAERKYDGTLVSGDADLVVETSTEILIIDHKTLPRPVSDDSEKMASFAGQLGTYRSALRLAFPKHRVRCFIHQPTAALVTEIDCKD